MPESVYRQRNSQNSPYYQCVEDHFKTFELVVITAIKALNPQILMTIHYLMK